MLQKNVAHLNDKKLSIMLFLIDHEALQTTGNKIFGDEYIKEARHPEPKILTEVFEILANNEDLEEDDFRLDFIQELLSFVDISIVEKPKFIELKFSKFEEEFDESIYTKDELKLITNIINRYKETTPRNIANECFKLQKVRDTQKGETII